MNEIFKNFKSWFVVEFLDGNYGKRFETLAEAKQYLFKYKARRIWNFGKLVYEVRK